jgi:hypothetical protein
MHNDSPGVKNEMAMKNERHRRQKPVDVRVPRVCEWTRCLHFHQVNFLADQSNTYQVTTMLIHNLVHLQWG